MRPFINLEYSTFYDSIDFNILTTEQIQQICEEIKKEKRVSAIMLTGSYVFDLDIRMVTNDGYQKAHWDDLWKFGEHIAFYNTPEFIRELFEKARMQILPPNVIHLGKLSMIQQESQKHYKKRRK